MKKGINQVLLYFVPIIIIAILISIGGNRMAERKEISINEFIQYIDNDEIKTLTTRGSEIFGTLRNEEKFEVYSPSEFRVSLYDNYLKEAVERNNIEYNGVPEPGKPWYLDILPTLFTVGIILFLWFMFMNQTQGGGNNKVMNFGKSKAKLSNAKDLPQITFDDVAGLVEEKEELNEIVDFLKSPKKYIDIGARIPKGVLLVGPPGTGKTYLSKAVAGEAKVPFFNISGSDFVEMFVGVGASRVRDLFEQAKRNSPCIIFIDEIDAVGRKRGAGVGGGHDEREQTLNQLLVEMDGFGTNEGIIVMAATNRPDILDPAILRPGRFDREVFVGIPDVREREAILKIHTKNKKLENDVNLENIAKRTTGFTPADLENVCNEAALLSARNNLQKIPARIFEEAAIKVIAGPEKKSAVVIEKERVLTAYHESGHAIVSRLLPDADAVHMITIVPRGMAGGFTAYLPKEEKKYQTKIGMKHELISLLGGRAAEELILKDISTGASNDIERATKIARNMVTKYGMSKKMGPMAYQTQEGEVFLGNEIGRGNHFSDEVVHNIDQEMRSLIDEAYHKALYLLSENESLLHALAKELLDKETIDADEFESLFLKFHNENIRVNPPKEVCDIRQIDEKIENQLQEKDHNNGE
ncbi:MAG: ATP-dependent zinc metalloprotease FtsH [Tissierellia bacterium]|nr:ATP-dependent zinc metalloprotease FtsH [Tissierellia bacterium]